MFVIMSTAANAHPSATGTMNELVRLGVSATFRHVTTLYYNYWKIQKYEIDNTHK